MKNLAVLVRGAAVCFNRGGLRPESPSERRSPVADPNHQRIVAEAMEVGTQEVDGFMFGEVILFHTLLQDFGLELVEPDQLIPLMERNMKRIEAFGVLGAGE